ncbi:MAG TPA: hypothetical protein VK894_01380, partial [Jiangellales bacterium]|nr:hypothetical protein [Jiangellales bacterium]
MPLSAALVAVALVAQMLGLGAAANAATTAAGSIAAVSTQPFELNSRALKEDLLTSLSPVVTAAPGPRRLADVAATVPLYVDGARYD